MSKRVFVEDAEFGVHAMVNSEFTLCGVAFDLSAVEENEGAIPRPTNKKTVTCDFCIQYIETCRGLRFKRL